MKKVKKNLFFEERFLGQHAPGESGEVGGGAPERKELWNGMTLNEFITEGLRQLKHLKTLVGEEGEEAEKVNALISKVATLGLIGVNSPSFDEAATIMRLRDIADEVHAFKVDVLGRIGESFEEEKKEDKKKVFKVTKKEVRDLYKEVREGDEIKETKKIWSAFVIRNYDEITKFLFDDSWNGKEIKKYHTDEWTNKERKEFVKAIQGFINKKFEDSGVEGRLKVDGFFGPRTETALRMYNAGTADKFDQLDAVDGVATAEGVGEKVEEVEKVKLAMRIRNALNGLTFKYKDIAVVSREFYADESMTFFDYSPLYPKYDGTEPSGRINLKYLDNGNVLVTSVSGESLIPLEMTPSTLSTSASIRHAIVSGFFEGYMGVERGAEDTKEGLDRDDRMDKLTDLYSQIPKSFIGNGISYAVSSENYRLNPTGDIASLSFSVVRTFEGESETYRCWVAVGADGEIDGVINNSDPGIFDLDNDNTASSFWANVAPAIERVVNKDEEEDEDGVEDLEDDDAIVDEKLEEARSLVSGFPEKFNVNGKEFFIQPGFSPLIEFRGKAYLRLNLEGDFGNSEDNTRYVTIGYDVETEEYNLKIGASPSVEVGRELTLALFKERIAAFIGEDFESEPEETPEVEEPEEELKPVHKRFNVALDNYKFVMDGRYFRVGAWENDEYGIFVDLPDGEKRVTQVDFSVDKGAVVLTINGKPKRFVDPIKELKTSAQIRNEFVAFVTPVLDKYIEGLDSKENAESIRLNKMKEMQSYIGRNIDTNHRYDGVDYILDLGTATINQNSRTRETRLFYKVRKDQVIDVTYFVEFYYDVESGNYRMKANHKDMGIVSSGISSEAFWDKMLRGIGDKEGGVDS